MTADVIRYYQLLDVKFGASELEIKRAYRDMAMVWHPDRFTDPRLQKKAEERLKEINAAYEFLKYYQPPANQQEAANHTSAYNEKPSAHQKPPDPVKTEARHPNFSNWKLYSAMYGTADRNIDVFSILKSQMENSRQKFKVSDEIFLGTHNHSSEKALTVIFRKGQKEHKMIFPAGSTVFISSHNRRHLVAPPRRKDKLPKTVACWVFLLVVLTVNSWYFSNLTSGNSSFGEFVSDVISISNIFFSVCVGLMYTCPAYCITQLVVDYLYYKDIPKSFLS
jgi:DnaJ domain